MSALYIDQTNKCQNQNTKGSCSLWGIPNFPDSGFVMKIEWRFITLNFAFKNMFAARNSALSYPCTFMSSISAVLLQRMSVCKAKNVSFLVQHRTKSYQEKQTVPKVINVAFGSKKEQSWPCRQETWERSTFGDTSKARKTISLMNWDFLKKEAKKKIVIFEQVNYIIILMLNNFFMSQRVYNY